MSSNRPADDLDELGKQYVVKASLGHIKYLPKRDLAVDIEHGFEPRYEVIEGKLPTSGSLYAVLTEMNRRLEAVAESGIQTGIPAHREWFNKSRQEVHTFGLTALAPVLDSLSKEMSPQAIVKARYLTHLYSQAATNLG